MKFTDRELLPGEYRSAFLESIDLIAPEVFESLQAIAPKFEAVFGQDFNPHSNRSAAWICTAADTGYAFHDLDGTINPVRLLLELTGDTRFLQIDRSNFTPEDRIKLLDFFDLRDGYQSFIKQFSLETDWLRTDLFRLLSDIVRYPKHIKHMWQAYTHGWMLREGDPLTFEFGGWEIGQDSQDYGENARRAFENRLKEYIAATAQQFQADGYKQKTKPDRRKDVRWLVHWTVKQQTKAEILAMMDADRSEKSGKEQFTDESTLNKLFQKLKGFDLPVREEKSKAQKAG